MQRICSLVLFTFLIVAAPRESSAVVQFYSTLPSWLAAVGTPDVVEDFQGFAVDTPFTIVSGPVALAGGMSMVEIGTTTPLSVRNKIDVAPFDLSQSTDGSTYANMNLDVPDHSVRITFANPVMAWGADFAQARGGAFLQLAVLDPGGELSNMTIPFDNSFLGFGTTAGETVVSVILRGDSGGTTEEDLGMDNVRLVFIPEPTTLVLCLLACVPAVCQANRRR